MQYFIKPVKQYVSRINWGAFQYSRRNRFLKEAGIENYKEFLASRVWKELKNRAKNAKSDYWRKCLVCGSAKNLNLHHIRYRRKMLVDGDAQNLRPLCKYHHLETHGMANSKNKPLRWAFNKLVEKYSVDMDGIKTSIK